MGVYLFTGQVERKQPQQIFNGSSVFRLFFRQRSDVCLTKILLPIAFWRKYRPDNFDGLIGQDACQKRFVPLITSHF